LQYIETRRPICSTTTTQTEPPGEQLDPRGMLNPSPSPPTSVYTPLLSPEDVAERDQSSIRHDVPASVQRPGTTFTRYGLLLGLVFGAVTCCMNIYLGLQTGGVNGLPLPTAFISQMIPAERFGYSPLTAKETLFVVTVATSASVMPMTAGLLGVIPALQYRIEAAEKLELSWQALILWSLCLCFFGPLLTMMSHEWFLMRRPLAFPNSVALVQVIRNLPNSAKSSIDTPVALSDPQRHEGLTEQETEGPPEATEQAAPVPPKIVSFLTLKKWSAASAGWVSSSY